MRPPAPRPFPSCEMRPFIAIVGRGSKQLRGYDLARGRLRKSVVTRWADGACVRWISGLEGELCGTEIYAAFLFWSFSLRGARTLAVCGGGWSESARLGFPTEVRMAGAGCAYQRRVALSFIFSALVCVCGLNRWKLRARGAAVRVRKWRRVWRAGRAHVWMVGGGEVSQTLAPEWSCACGGPARKVRRSSGGFVSSMLVLASPGCAALPSLLS